MARPKIDPANRRTTQINLRLSPAEMATLQQKADASGVTVTTLVRRAALSRKLVSSPVSSVDFETRSDLRRIGVNLNQIAKALNARRDALPASLIETCRRLDTLFDRIMPYGSQDHERRS